MLIICFLMTTTTLITFIGIICQQNNINVANTVSYTAQDHHMVVLKKLKQLVLIFTVQSSKNS